VTSSTTDVAFVAWSARRSLRDAHVARACAAHRVQGISCRTDAKLALLDGITASYAPLAIANANFLRVSHELPARTLRLDPAPLSLAAQDRLSFQVFRCCSLSGAKLWSSLSGGFGTVQPLPRSTIAPTEWHRSRANLACSISDRRVTAEHAGRVAASYSLLWQIPTGLSYWGG